MTAMNTFSSEKFTMQNIDFANHIGQNPQLGLSADGKAPPLPQVPTNQGIASPHHDHLNIVPLEDQNQVYYQEYYRLCIAHVVLTTQVSANELAAKT